MSQPVYQDHSYSNIALNKILQTCKFSMGQNWWLRPINVYQICDYLFVIRIPRPLGTAKVLRYTSKLFCFFFEMKTLRSETNWILWRSYRYNKYRSLLHYNKAWLSKHCGPHRLLWRIMATLLLISDGISWFCSTGGGWGLPNHLRNSFFDQSFRHLVGKYRVSLELEGMSVLSMRLTHSRFFLKIFYLSCFEFAKVSLLTWGNLSPDH